MTHGSLFSGIGGIDLGFEMAGIKTSWTCEIDEWANSILKERFPSAKHYKDIVKINKNNLERVDIISGGFPCQDISLAGKGEGLNGKRSGLWFEMWRVIGELQPRWVLIENVANLTAKGGCRVLHDLAKIGYDAEWQIISARDVGARHLRRRIWIIAYKREVSNSESIRHRGWNSFERNSKEWSLQQDEQKGTEMGSKAKRCDIKLSDSGSNRRNIASKQIEENSGESSQEKNIQGNTAIKPPRDVPRKNRRRNQSEPSGKNRQVKEFKIKTFSILKDEPRLDRVAYGISQKVDRYKDRIKGLGNAVVPQIPYIIGKRILKLNKLMEE